MAQTRADGDDLVMSNELISVTIRPSQGADILTISHLPTSTQVLWHREPADDVGSGRSQADRYGDFYDRYPGGMQELFPNAGAACTFEDADLPMHGEACRVPWSLRAAESGRPARVVCRTELWRTPFTMEREFVLHDDASSVQIHSTITNRSPRRMPVAWGFHPAFGEPFLGPNMRLYLDGERVNTRATPIGPHSAYGDATELQWHERDPYDLGKLNPGHAGTSDLLFISVADGWYALQNEDTGLTVTARWSRDVFPFVWLWQECRSDAGWPWWGEHHIVGIEPHTSPTDDGLVHQIEHGHAVDVPPRGSLEAWLELGVAAGPPHAVIGVAERGDPIYAARQPEGDQT